MKEFISVNTVWYGNTESGEIAEVAINGKKQVRGGYEYQTEKGSFLAFAHSGFSFVGKDVFCTEKKEVVKTMEENIWGMDEDAQKRFQECKDQK